MAPSDLLSHSSVNDLDSSSDDVDDAELETPKNDTTDSGSRSPHGLEMWKTTPSGTSEPVISMKLFRCLLDEIHSIHRSSDPASGSEIESPDAMWIVNHWLCRECVIDGINRYTATRGFRKVSSSDCLLYGEYTVFSTAEIFAFPGSLSSL